MATSLPSRDMTRLRYDSAIQFLAHFCENKIKNPKVLMPAIPLQKWGYAFVRVLCLVIYIQGQSSPTKRGRTNTYTTNNTYCITKVKTYSGH